MNKRGKNVSVEINEHNVISFFCKYGYPLEVSEFSELLFVKMFRILEAGLMLLL